VASNELADIAVSDHFNLGTHTKEISTTSEQAQHWFNVGLNWCFGFNQEEGVRSFLKALEYDSGCVMAHWGVAYAAGPFYNYAWCDFGAEEAAVTTKRCYDHIAAAIRFKSNASDLENQLVQALACRFQKPHPVSLEEFCQWDDAYADAMRNVYHQYSDDHDVMALFAEAMMTRTPWKLWDVSCGIPPAGADTYEALEIIERSLSINKATGTPPHPAILHLHIHLTEMSAEPERAKRSADTLVGLCPDAGHLNHMPGHVYVLCGDYAKAKRVSEKAIAANEKYLAYAGPYNFYTTARCHDLHLMMYTCMFLGQYQPALKAAEQMCNTLSEDVLRHSGRVQVLHTMEGYYSMKMHVLVRFGRWQEIIDTPLPADTNLYCVSTAMHHYAKGVAYAALKNILAAEQQLDLFYNAIDRIPDNRKFFNNQARTTLGIGEKMLVGELEYHKGNYELAFDHLRESISRDDKLEYSEPWAWMHPPRHALGALLLEQKCYTEAEEVYRTDLGLNDKLYRCAQHPENVWALHGLVECLRYREDKLELDVYAEKLNRALAQSDGSVKSSCMCRSAITSGMQ